MAVFGASGAGAGGTRGGWPEASGTNNVNGNLPVGRRHTHGATFAVPGVCSAHRRIAAAAAATPAGEQGWRKTSATRCAGCSAAESKVELVLTPPNMGASSRCRSTLAGDLQTTAQFIAEPGRRATRSNARGRNCAEAPQQAGIRWATLQREHLRPGRERAMDAKAAAVGERGEAGARATAAPAVHRVWLKQQQGMVDTFA